MDPLLKKIQQNAETLFLPKKILTYGDWLIDHREKSQTFNMYNRQGVRNDVTAARSKIYFHVTDDKIKKDFLAKLKRYCEAFYTGMTIDIMYPPSTKTSQEFMKLHQIPSREGYSGYTQYLAPNILTKTIP